MYLDDRDIKELCLKDVSTSVLYIYIDVLKIYTSNLKDVNVIVLYIFEYMHENTF
jgi:hypothetical protein